MTIEGLRLIEDFVSPSVESALLRETNAGEWDAALKRRVRHFGWRYDYSKRGVGEGAFLGPFPPWLKDLVIRVGVIAGAEFDQAIVNEYLPGQGIAPHVDSPAFCDVVASLSLGSATVMAFDDSETERRTELSLPPRSLLVLTGQARWRWRHGIAPRKSDVVEGRRVSRGRRVSITFRTVMKDRR
ncbi:MAG: alpha-ketoglutarate-dependent dioxygenase AlkB [Pseudomonadota bacterium]